MHAVRSTALLVLALAPSAALAQSTATTAIETAETPIDVTTSRLEHETPDETLELESSGAIPPCSAGPSWGRSILDGGLASRRRPADLPCRTVWESPIRFELGLVGGGVLERGDGAIGGFSVQLGLRFHQLFSVYWQTWLLGGYWSNDVGVLGEAYAIDGVMFETSPFERFAIALGPTFDLSAGCGALEAQTDTACRYEWSYGLSSRATVSLFDVDDVGVSLTADLHVGLLKDGARSTALLGLGLRL
ncbi:MAG: hypothetical protein AB7S26_28145 [Sandaracinaceae bacterium]